MKRTLFVLLNRVVNAVVRRVRPARFRGARVLLLTTTGRKSGKQRTVPLAFVPDGDSYVVAASNGGADWEPGWWLNLQADAHGTVEVDRERRPVTAAAVEGDDYDVQWRRLSEQLDAYDGYQAKVRRRIALVRLTPVG